MPTAAAPPSARGNGGERRTSARRISPHDLPFRKLNLSLTQINTPDVRYVFQTGFGFIGIRHRRGFRHIGFPDIASREIFHVIHSFASEGSVRRLPADAQIQTTTMSKEYNLISDFDYRIIAAFFAGLDRQGPGDDAQTRRALSFIDGTAAPSPHSRHRLRHRTPDGSARIGARRPRHGRRPAARNDRGIAPANGNRRPDGASHGHRRLDAVAALRRGVVRPAVGRRFHLQHRLREGADPVAAVPQTRRVHRRHGVFVAIVRTARRNGILPRQLP